MDENQAATAIQAAFRAHRSSKNLANLDSVPPATWTSALLSARTALLYKNNAANMPKTTRAIWRRGEFLASLLGKGIGKESLTLLTEHWLELSDRHHRYGSNLKLYHEAWLHSKTTQPFFYWLDQGEGKDLSLPERPRERLESERVTYITAAELRKYRVVVKDGLLVYALSGELVHTLDESADVKEALPDADPNDTEEERLRKKVLRNKRKFIYVADTSWNLYVGQKQKGQFHHSSFLNGAQVCAAGGLVVDHGKLIKINPKSGHYRPQVANFEKLVARLKQLGVDFTHVTVSNPFALTKAGSTVAKDPYEVEDPDE